MTRDLPDASVGHRERMGPSAFVLRGLALPYVDDLLSAITCIEPESPFRHMVPPSGFTMSVELTNCGEFGWTTDRRGYRYTRIDPESQRPRPPMPPTFSPFARLGSSCKPRCSRGSNDHRRRRVA